MAQRAYDYEYGTSPRKLKPEYEPRKTNKKKPVNKPKNKTKKEEKKKAERKAKSNLFIKFLILFAILFLIIFRNSQINESFSKIQELKTNITTLQKENDQLEVGIQNSINLNNIEQAAKELLGMQKRTNKQTVYINLSKKDYVEPKSEKIILEDEESFWDKIIEKLKNIF